MEPDSFRPRLVRPSFAGLVPLGGWRVVSSEREFRSSLRAWMRGLAYMQPGEGPVPAAALADRVPAPSPSKLRPTLREVRGLIREDATAFGDRRLPGARALRVHRFGAYAYALPRGPWRTLATRAYNAAFRRVRDRHGIEIPHTVKVGRRVVIDHQSGIVVNGASVIGDECILRQGVTLGTKDRSDPHAAPVLGARVDVGAGAKILGRVHVGEGARIGANAVVVSDVPAGATVVGVPARIVRMPETPTPDAALVSTIAEPSLMTTF